MHRISVGLLALPVALAVLAAPSRAQEVRSRTGTYTKGPLPGGADGSIRVYFSWNASYLVLELPDDGAEKRVNDALMARVRLAEQQAIAHFRSDPDHRTSYYGIEMKVGHLSPRMLSVSVATTSYTAIDGASIETKRSALTFDLRTGEPVPLRALIAGDDAMVELNREIQSEVDRRTGANRYGTAGRSRHDPPLPPVSSARLTSALVEPDGLTFYYEDFPHRLGDPAVKLPFGQLSELVSAQLRAEGVLGLSPPPDPAAPTPTPGLVGALGGDSADDPAGAASTAGGATLTAVSPGDGVLIAADERATLRWAYQGGRGQRGFRVQLARGTQMLDDEYYTSASSSGYRVRPLEPGTYRWRVQVTDGTTWTATGWKTFVISSGSERGLDSSSDESLDNSSDESAGQRRRRRARAGLSVRPE
jgi:hypothetical protein